MKLTTYTDYSLRVLIHLGSRTDRLCSIAEMARDHRISQNHLVKVVHNLIKSGYLVSVRGRFGGVRLARPPAGINIGAVVRMTEEGFDLVPCDRCVLSPACRLTKVLDTALRRFLDVLDNCTLADLLVTPAEMAQLFGSATAAPSKGPAAAAADLP